MSNWIVLLNWNGCNDTIDCLESICAHNHVVSVVVCDNGSTDNSHSRLLKWATDFFCSAPAEQSFSHLTFRHLPTTIDRFTNKNQAFTLIQNGRNLGFAGGCNVGVEYALQQGAQYIWLLNNDTVIDANTLPALLAKIQSDPSIGIVGSTLVYFDQPQTVQALGGSAYDPTVGVGAHLGIGQTIETLPDESLIEAKMDYVVGASMLVSRDFLTKIGLMSEDYFLYYEELDWAVRAKGHFRLAWASQSIVRHKEGASIGSSHRDRPSDVSLKYMYQNRLKISRRFFRPYFRRVQGRIFYEFLVYTKRLDFSAATIILRALLSDLLDFKK